MYAHRLGPGLLGTVASPAARAVPTAMPLLCILPTAVEEDLTQETITATVIIALIQTPSSGLPIRTPTIGVLRCRVPRLKQEVHPLLQRHRPRQQRRIRGQMDALQRLSRIRIAILMEPQWVVVVASMMTRK